MRPETLVFKEERRLATKTVSVKVDLKKYSLDAARYAAYAVSGEAFVFIGTAGKGSVAVALTPKSGAPGPRLKARFIAELEDEALREAVSDNNRELREFLTLKALSPEKRAAAVPDSGLTPEQEKELADLISQVEKEIKEDVRGAAADPLGVTSTWEDKYGAKKPRKK